MEHLALEIFDLTGNGSKFAALPRDTVITITDTSEIFASGDVWTYDFRLNVAACADIFGSAGDIHGSRLHEQLNKRRARLWAEGIPMHLGYLKLNDEAEVDADGNVDVSFWSGQKTFDELIDGAKANQVPLMGNVRFGVALWRKRWVSYGLKMSVYAKMTNGDTSEVTDLETPIGLSADGEDVSIQKYPRMVFPKATLTQLSSDVEDTEGTGTVTIDELNTDQPYDEDQDGTPTHPFCNVALCYQKYGFLKQDDNGVTHNDYSGEPAAERGYEYMPADRVNSAPMFFVIYWIRCLMKHLGIHVEENQMMDVQDLRRLFFVNTKCAYREPKYIGRFGSEHEPDSGYGRYLGIGGSRLVAEQYAPEKIIKEGKLTSSSFTATKIEGDQIDGPDIEYIVLKLKEALPGDGLHIREALYKAKNSYYHDAYATSDCFPDVDIAEVIKALEDGFGVRFLFSDDYKRVRIVLLRNIFRDSEVQHINADILSVGKQENSIRGFRMTYGNKENTEFYYKGFADKLPHKKELWPDDSDKHDYSQWSLNESYGNLLNKVTAFNKTCYVTPDTGDAYGVKVDEQAKRYKDLHPSLFEYAGYMDAEDGDCTGEEETIKTLTLNFKPAIMNDLNMTEERDAKTDDQRKQVFALFVDEAMRPRRPDLQDGTDYNDADAVYSVDKMVELYGPNSNNKMTADDGTVKPGEFAIASDMEVAVSGLGAEGGNIEIAYIVRRAGILLPFRITWLITNLNAEGSISEGYRLYLQDNFEPNDDGICPVEKHDWGLTLGIMRGSGSDASVRYDADIDDGEGNDTWDIVAGSSVTAHPDICDNYGREWDYNGTQEGVGSREGRVSLKLRAEKPNPYFDPSLPETRYDPEHPELNTNPRYLPITDENLRGRGLCDTFHKEESIWERNARILPVELDMGLAELLAIDKTKKVQVGDVLGLIRKMQYTISNETGLGKVKMEIMYI